MRNDIGIKLSEYEVLKGNPDELIDRLNGIIKIREQELIEVTNKMRCTNIPFNDQVTDISSIDTYTLVNTPNSDKAVLQMDIKHHTNWLLILSSL